MPADLNTGALVGRLTRDPEVRQTASGSNVANLRVAFTTRQKMAGEWTDKSNYIDVVVFGAMADNVATYLSKGRRIGIQYRLAWSEWQAQDGTNRQKVELIAENIQYLDSNPNAAANDGGAAKAGGGDLPIDEPVYDVVPF